MENGRTQLAINNLEGLIDVVFESEFGREEIKKAIGKYREAILRMRQKDDYTSKDFEMFHTGIDDCFQVFVHYFSRDICTNYTHDLLSGHVLKGWEALNALSKAST